MTLPRYATRRNAVRRAPDRHIVPSRPGGSRTAFYHHGSEPHPHRSRDYDRHPVLRRYSRPRYDPVRLLGRRGSALGVPRSPSIRDTRASSSRAGADAGERRGTCSSGMTRRERQRRLHPGEMGRRYGGCCEVLFCRRRCLCPVLLGTVRALRRGRMFRLVGTSCALRGYLCSEFTRELQGEFGESCSDFRTYHRAKSCAERVGCSCRS